MPKPQDIFQLARQEAVRVTASPQAWQSFLYTAAHNYHTTYLNQLLIHAQRPDAAACASMEYWNTKANRLVMRGSRSITVLQRRQGVAATKPVFAIDDTILLSQTHTGGPWEVTNTTRLLLLQGKSDDWLTALAQEGVSNDADRARRMLERNVADSTLQWAQPDEQMQLLQALVTQSAVYIARLRIGLPVQDEDYPAFQSVSQFDTCQISLCLGGYLQAAAEPMLNAIGREALRLNRDSIAIPYEPVHNESTPTQLNSREETVTHDLHEEPRGLPDSEPFPAEPAEPVSEPLREAASGISGTERADALRPADAGGHAADELQPNRKSRAADGGQDSARADADHPDAGPQDEPAGLHLPQYHIERLFIPEHYVQRNVEHGSCAISLYPGWQYSYVPIGSEKTRKSISGAELAQSLGGVVQVGTSESSLARRVANVERRAGIANAQELGKLLGSMADNGLHLAADFDKQISAYQREEMKLRNEVAELRSKSKTYAATAHNLQACRTYKSVWLEYTSKPLAQKDTFYKKNEAALQTYCRAASQLDKMGISLGTEPEKVRQLVTETESRIADLIAELEKVRKSNRAIQEDKEKVEQIQSG